jgi:membrane protein YdbS with pleckstrin-like domain
VSDLNPETDRAPVAGPPAWLSDASEQRLHPNFVPCERLAGWIVTAVLGGGSVVGVVLLYLFVVESVAVNGVLAGIALVLVALLCWSAHGWPPIDYRHRSFRVSDTGIQIHKGVLWRSVMDVPISRVQHTDVNQGPIERRFGLAHLIIHTAGTTSASVRLEGLGHETAVAIRDHLVVSDSDDAV